jgi:hypothetical protein
MGHEMVEALPACKISQRRSIMVQWYMNSPPRLLAISPACNRVHSFFSMDETLRATQASLGADGPIDVAHLSNGELFSLEEDL